MSERNTDKAQVCFRTAYTLLTVMLIGFIFGNSFADGETSSGLSMFVTDMLNSILRQLKAPILLSYAFVRKLAHFAEYSLLGALLTALVWSWRRSWKINCVWQPIAIGGLIASADEFIQTFTPERCGAVSDVLLDLCGVLWAAIAVSLLCSFTKKAERNISK